MNVKVTVYLVVLSGDMYDDDSWIENQVFIDKKKAISWASEIIGKLAHEWNIPLQFHSYGDNDEYTVYMDVKDIPESEMALVLEDSNSNRVYYKLTKYIF